jgi:hypothetical protein
MQKIYVLLSTELFIPFFHNLYGESGVLATADDEVVSFVDFRRSFVGTLRMVPSSGVKGQSTD